MFAAILLLCLMTSSLTIAGIKHGEPQEPFNFWTQLIAVIIEITLLYFAGFFDVFTK